MKFKKVLSVLVALGLVTVMAAGCSSSGGDQPLARMIKPLWWAHRRPLMLKF